MAMMIAHILNRCMYPVYHKSQACYVDYYHFHFFFFEKRGASHQLWSHFELIFSQLNSMSTSMFHIQCLVSFLCSSIF